MKAFGRTTFALGILSVLVIGLWYSWYSYAVRTFPDSAKISDDLAKVLAARGQLGDLFGGINALFTALLLAGALYTVWLQQRQIAALQEQQVSQDLARKEMSQLQAMTALVSARSTLVHTRYEMNRDFVRAAQEKTIDEKLLPLWTMMQYVNADAMSKDFKSLGDLASHLDRLLNVGSEDGNSAA
jgi:hypothetical protein